MTLWRRCRSLARFVGLAPGGKVFNVRSVGRHPRNLYTWNWEVLP